MTIGDRIKKIRVFRKMTMDELGAALGFEGKNMSVRVSQYETGARIPREDMIQKIAEALNCNYKALDDYSLGAAEDIIETFFWLEEGATAIPARGTGIRFPEYEGPGNLISLTPMTPVTNSADVKSTSDDKPSILDLPSSINCLAICLDFSKPNKEGYVDLWFSISLPIGFPNFSS